MNLGIGRLKFVESGTFRSLRTPVNLDRGSLMHKSVVEIAGVAWKVTGCAPNPNRGDETLVFVEIVRERREMKHHNRRASDRR